MVRKICINPFKFENHVYRAKAVSCVGEVLIEKAKHFGIKLIIGDHICQNCRVKFENNANKSDVPNDPDVENEPGNDPVTAQEPIEASDPVTAYESAEANDPVPGTSKGMYIDSSESEYETTSRRTELNRVETPTTDYELNFSCNNINKSLLELGVSPIKKQRLSRKSNKYAAIKMDEIDAALSQKIFNIPSNNKQTREELDNWLLIFKDVVKKSSYADKIFLLSTLPESWNSLRIEKEFDLPRSICKKVEDLVKIHGHGARIDSRPARYNMDRTMDDAIIKFYQDDEHSRLLPGKKDCVTVGQGKDREKKQKRLLLLNLSEAYHKFKSEMSTDSVSFSKFCLLRPKECVLAGSSGTHSVCVCMIHQNIYLMCQPLYQMMGCRFKNDKELLQTISCSRRSFDCSLNKCNDCDMKMQQTFDNMEKYFDDNGVENITFSAWSMQDRCSLNKINKSTDEFMEDFKLKLRKLKEHDFIAVHQAKYFKDTKSNLKDNEYVIVADFSENYVFVNQDEIQAGHWMNTSSTIFPIVAYYKEEGELKCISYAIISEIPHHNTVSVHLYIGKFITWLKSQNGYPVPKQMFYFSDGSPAQFKNKKNIANICYHSEDFGIECEWNFFATSHGKGPSDGIGGTIKRMSTKAALQCTEGPLFTDAKTFFTWAKNKLQEKTKIILEFGSNEEYQMTEAKLSSRFEKLKTIPGTQQIHQLIPSNDFNIIHTKRYSECLQIKSFNIYKK